MYDEVVTSEELADLRTATQSWYDHLCDIYGQSPGADDAYGGHTNEPDILKASGVRCSVESGAEHEQTRALISQEVLSQTFAVTLPALQPVVVDDEIVVTTLSNLRIRVTALMTPESWEIERRVLGTILGAE